METPLLYPTSNKTETLSREIFNSPTLAHFPLEWRSLYGRTVATTAEEVGEILGLNLPMSLYLDNSGHTSFTATYDGTCTIRLNPRIDIRHYYFDDDYRIPTFKYGETSTRAKVSHELFHAWVWEYDRERYLRDCRLVAKYGYQSELVLVQEKCAKTFSQLYAQAHLETNILGKIGFKARTWLENWYYDGQSDQYRKDHPELANYQ